MPTETNTNSTTNQEQTISFNTFTGFPNARNTTIQDSLLQPLDISGIKPTNETDGYTSFLETAFVPKQNNQNQFTDFLNQFNNGQIPQSNGNSNINNQAESVIKVATESAKVATEGVVKQAASNTVTQAVANAVSQATNMVENSSTTASVQTSTTSEDTNTISNSAINARMAENRQTVMMENTTNNDVPIETDNATQSNETYTVQAGDTLSEIVKNQTGDGSYENYMRIAKENGIDDPNNIRVGQTITFSSNNNEIQNTSIASNNSSDHVSNANVSSSYDSSSGGSYDMQQIQFLNADLYTEVKAGEFEEFMYDCEADASLNAIKDVIEKAEDLKTSTSNLEKALDSLATEVYANRPEIKKSLDSHIATLIRGNEQINTNLDEWCQGVKAFYEDQVTLNQDLMNDLQTINDYLDDGNFSDWNR